MILILILKTESRMQNTHPFRIPVAILLLALTVPVGAQANERLFTYTYETGVLPKGGIELEPWVTTRIGRSTFFFRMDHRLELEWGLGRGVMTALYLNHRVEAKADGAGGLTQTSKFRGFSHEVKFQLSNPVADAIGSALYFEYGVQPHEVELEAKTLLDKALGRTLLAFNLVGEMELKFVPESRPNIESKFIALLGASFELGRGVQLGLEVRNLNVWEGNELELALLSAGPALSVASENAWFAITALPQIYDFASSSHNIEDYEYIEARMLVGVHLR
jgi:hypothetical protein